MERKKDILKTKYFKVHSITDSMYKKRAAFKLKNKDGNIYNVSYLEFKDDVVSFGTSLINLGLMRKNNFFNW